MLLPLNVDSHVRIYHLQLTACALRSLSMGVQGTEKVILIQEQLSKNRVLIALDRQGNVEARCTSYTTERKVQTNMLTRHGKILLAHSAFK